MLNYKRYGVEESVLVILHGLFGMLDNWSTVAKSLQDNHSVILVDQRNHGRSFHSDEFNYSLLAVDIIDLLDYLEIDRCAILGHSMGGKAAIQFAHDFPDRLSQLITIDMGIKGYPRGHDDLFKAILGLRLDEIGSRKEADAGLSKSIGDMGTRQFLLKNLRRTSEGKFEWKANFKGLLESYDEIIAPLELIHRIPTPTLLVRGTKSSYVMDDDIRGIESWFSEIQISDIDAGHWVHAERPTELISLLMRFLT